MDRLLARLDASAREVAEAAAPVAALRGADERGIAEWRRMTKALDTSLQREMRKLGDTPTKTQIATASRAGRAAFDRNFPKARQEKIFADQYARTHRAALKVAGSELGKEKRALAGAVDDKRLARAWVNDQRRLLAKVAGQTSRDYRRTAGEATSKAERRELLRGRASVLESRADLIGSNETHNAMARSTRAIYKAAGVERATWNTQRDDDVRPEHEARDTQEYAVKDGIDGEQPGEPIACRCFALPVVAQEQALAA